LTLDVGLPRTKYTGPQQVAFFQQVIERLKALPGVQSAGAVYPLPLSGAEEGMGFGIEGRADAAPGEPSSAGPRWVSPDYFNTMGIPLLRGRELSERDGMDSPRVLVINEALAARYFPDEDPIGKRFTFDSSKPDEVEIVGLAQDAKYTRQRDEIPPTAYASWRQELRLMSGATFEVRTAGDPTAAVAAVREAVRQVDSNLPLNNVKTQIEQADETLRMERLFAKLLTLFGLLAQQLAAIGLFGVIAYAVSQRTREIGIRMALGADRSDVLKMILRQGMTLALIGVTLGLAGAYVLTKYLESSLDLKSMLYGVQVSDPLTYGVIAVGLTLVAMAACYIPARRATKVDPMVALRCE